jgi:exodeoxyribonuclease VII small subunit
MAEAEPVAELSFEAAMAELERIVGQLESGAASLEDSIGLYARGAELRAHCEAKLRAAEERVAQIALGPDGTPATRPLDLA